MKIHKAGRRRSSEPWQSAPRARGHTEGDYKPFVKRLRSMQEKGLLAEVAVPGKHIYTYRLDGKQPPSVLPYPKPYLLANMNPMLATA